MAKQLLVTMRSETAEQFAANSVPPLFADLAPEATSLKLIGKPGYSSRVVVDDTDEAYLRDVLKDRFIVEDDYTLQTGPGLSAGKRRPF